MSAVDVNEGPTSPVRVVIAIREALMTGDLLPGQRLVEADLCLRFGAGRSQVREALNQLVSGNIVEISRNKGASIRRMSIVEARDAIDVMELLVGLAARLAARNVKLGGSKTALTQAIDNLNISDATGDSRSLLSARRRIYQVLMGLSQNRELERIVNSLQYHVLHGQVMLRQLHVEMNHGLALIAQAVLDGDEAAAEQRGRDHIRKMRPD